MAHIDHFECDECSVRVRRITVHKSELNDAYPDLHFCGTDCLDQFIRNIDVEAAEYWLRGQDLRDGA